MSIQRLSHIGICVSDLGRSIAFYRDRLGFQVVSQIRVAGELVSTLLDLAGVDLHAVYLERDGFRIELLQYLAPATVDGGARPLNQLGLTHLSLRVSDLGQMLDQLRAGQVNVLERTRIDIAAVHSGAVFITDPDGTLIELVESPGDPALLPGQ